MVERVKQDFLSKVKNFEMIVKQDDGVNRELIFRQLDDSHCWFGLKTWNNHLCFFGDMGTMVFSRLSDMFIFFRREELVINTGYWQQLVSISRFGSDTEFSPEAFKDAVRSEWEHLVEEHDLDKSKAGELWGEMQEQIFGGLDYANEECAYTLVQDFESMDGYKIEEFEADLQRPTYQFIWALYAIVWGIQKYDQSKLKEVPEL